MNKEKRKLKDNYATAHLLVLPDQKKQIENYCIKFDEQKTKVVDLLIKLISKDMPRVELTLLIRGEK